MYITRETCAKDECGDKYGDPIQGGLRCSNARPLYSDGERDALKKLNPFVAGGGGGLDWRKCWGLDRRRELSLSLSLC